MLKRGFAVLLAAYLLIAVLCGASAEKTAGLVAVIETCSETDGGNVLCTVAVSNLTDSDVKDLLLTFTDPDFTFLAGELEAGSTESYSLTLPVGITEGAPRLVVSGDADGTRLTAQAVFASENDTDEQTPVIAEANESDTNCDEAVNAVPFTEETDGASDDCADTAEKSGLTFFEMLLVRLATAKNFEKGLIIAAGAVALIALLSVLASSIRHMRAERND